MSEVYTCNEVEYY